MREWLAAAVVLLQLFSCSAQVVLLRKVGAELHSGHLFASLAQK
jgi:hypothetical protein